jgi:hypothetical protein
MNDRSDIERVLGYWLEDGPVAMPDRVVDVVARRISQRPQRRSWRLLRRSPMSQILRWGAAAAAVLVLAIAGYSVLPRNGPWPGGPPTPSPVPSPTTPVEQPSPTEVACEDLLPGCAGPLAAGEHSTSQFVPAVRYTTPAGWINTIDIESLVALSTGYSTPDPILVWSGIVPAEKGADCVLEAKQGVGTSVDDWVTYLTTHPGLNATNVHETSLAGTRAVVLDLSSNLGWATPCADDVASKSVPIIKTIGDTPGDGYGTGNDGRVRLYVVGAGSETVLVTIYSYSGGDAAFIAMLPQVEPIVQSFTFACKSDSPPGPCWGPPDASGNPATPPPTPAP